MRNSIQRSDSIGFYATAAWHACCKAHRGMSEPEKPSPEPYGPRAPSAAEITERSGQLQTEFDKHARQVRAKLTVENPEPNGRSEWHATPGVFEAWAISKLARAEAYLEYYGSLLIAIGKKLQRSDEQ